MKTAHLQPVDRPTNAADVPMQPASWDIWDKKYRLTAKDGRPIDETIDATYQRVARALADVERTLELREQWHEQFLWALRHRAPSRRVASFPTPAPGTQAGHLHHQLHRFPGTILDSMDDILRKVHEAGLTLKSGSGSAMNFHLRPRAPTSPGPAPTLWTAVVHGHLRQDVFHRVVGGRTAGRANGHLRHRPSRCSGIHPRQARIRPVATIQFVSADHPRIHGAVKHDADWRLAFPLLAKEVEQDRVDLTDSDQIIWREWPTHQGLIVNESGQVACKIYRKIRARRLGM